MNRTEIGPEDDRAVGNATGERTTMEPKKEGGRVEIGRMGSGCTRSMCRLQDDKIKKTQNNKITHKRTTCIFLFSGFLSIPHGEIGLLEFPADDGVELECRSKSTACLA